MSETATLLGPPRARRLVRASLWMILVLASLASVVTLVGGIVSLVANLGRGQVQLTLVADKKLPGLAAEWSTDATVHVIGANYPAADLTLQGASPAVATFAIISAAALLLTQIALCILVAVLAWRLLRGGVFRRSIALTVTAAGGVLAIGGLLSQVGNAFGGALAASDLNGGGNGFWPLAGRFDPTLMVFGFVLLLVGLSFDYGTRLQKETEGLV